ncbi:MAG: hypothetical protein KF746_13350 [Chitinophagaceae bacterium]|nr:hypothetical protein [Chitinophagaceae bacterium]
MFKEFRLVRMSLLWTMTAILMCLHETYDVTNIMFGIDVKMPGADGTVPAIKHVLRLIFDIGSMLIAVLILYTQPKWLRWTLLVWAAVVVPANILHLIEVRKENPSHYSQIGIMVLELMISIFLCIDHYKWVKEPNGK